MKKVLPILMCLMLLSTATFASAKDVYVTQKGKKYHTQECRWIKNRKTTKLDQKEAEKQGYKPCKCVEKEEKTK